MRKLALAVDKAHAQGIIHRDIKPSNVMIPEEGEPVLMDFGLAQHWKVADARLTHSGLIVGTPSYMAPEQVEGDPDTVGPRADVYSLGGLLYELLVGEVPFRGSLLSVLSQLASDPPERPSTLDRTVDRRLEAICLKALCKRPADRYQSAAEMADDLEEYLKTGSQAGGTFSRWRLLAWGSAAAAAFILASVVLYLKTGEGTLVLEVNEPNVKVSIDGEQVHISSPRDEIDVKVGRHKLEVSKNGFLTLTESFSILRNQELKLKATLQKQAAGILASAQKADKNLRAFPEPSAGSFVSGEFSDEFEDGSIDQHRWVIGGERRGYRGAPSGKWTWSHNEIVAGKNNADGYLKLSVSGPYTGGTYGAEAWVRTSYDFNDGKWHTVNFKWQADVGDDHVNHYFIQLTNGYIPPSLPFHWQYIEPRPPEVASTLDLLWTYQNKLEVWHRGGVIGNSPHRARPSPPRHPPFDGHGKTDQNPHVPRGVPETWSIIIDPVGTARLYNGPDGTGSLWWEETLNVNCSWYIRFMVNDGTSAGFGVGEAHLKLYSFSVRFMPGINQKSKAGQPQPLYSTEQANQTAADPAVIVTQTPILVPGIPRGRMYLGYVTSDAKMMLLLTRTNTHIWNYDTETHQWRSIESLQSFGFPDWQGASCVDSKGNLYYSQHTFSPYETKIHRAVPTGQWWKPGMRIEGLGGPQFQHFPYFDGRQLYFTEEWGDSIWVADYDPTADRFSEAQLLTVFNEFGGKNAKPWVSSDGKMMLFASNRPGGFGGWDLYSARRISVTTNEWTGFANLGSKVNTAADETGAILAEKAKILYFCRGEEFGTRRTGMGQSDVMQAKAILNVAGEARKSGAVSQPSPEYDWKQYGGHLYALTKKHGTWQECEDEAIAVGGHLATVDDAQENAWLAECRQRTFGILIRPIRRKTASTWLSAAPNTKIRPT